LGGGKYSVSVTAKDYKKAEAVLKAELEKLMKPLEKRAAKLHFERTDR
jgi:translation initiation factor 2 alpha subunit (eIF-2alpha)